MEYLISIFILIGLNLVIWEPADANLISLSVPANNISENDSRTTSSFPDPIIWPSPPVSTSTEPELHLNPFINHFIPHDEFEQANCYKPTKKPCEPLLVPTCFGVKLPYAMTSTELVAQNISQIYVQYKLKQWEGLKAMPKCWAAIQPLLCSIYMPKCQNGSLELPSQEICKITRSPCKALEHAFKHGLPDILKCDNQTKFPAKCKTNALRDIRFNVSIGNCSHRLTEVAENSINEYKGFEGCGLKCQDYTFFDELEHERMSSIIFYLGLISMFGTGWVVLTFIIGWKSSSQYPSLAMFFVNLSYFIAILGWMLQFLPKGKEGIVCRGDTTIRNQEYSPGETVSCAFVFSLIYMGSMCALNWLFIFAYSWNQACHAVGRLGLEKKSRNFHITWVMALFLTIVSYLFGHVGGDTMTGICFIGYNDPTRRIVFLLAPLGIKVLVISFFMWSGVHRLHVLTSGKDASDFIAQQGIIVIRRQRNRVATFAIFMVLSTFLVFCFEIYAMMKKPLLEKALREDLLCELMLEDGIDCELPPRPGLTFHAGSFLFFLGGLGVSIKAWTPESLGIWRRFFTRFAGSSTSPSQTPHKAHKHHLIAKAFSKRNNIANGRLSLSVGTNHDDPLGLNKLLDPNHMGKECGKTQSACQTDPPVNISSEWVANLPHLVTRRGGIIPPHSSNSVSCISDDSRRPSCDSAAMSELAAKNLQGGSQSDLDDRRRSKRRWYNMGRRNRNGRVFNFGRKGIGGSSSSVSSASNHLPQMYPAITALIDKKLGQNGELGITQVISQMKPLTRDFAIQTSVERLDEQHIRLQRPLDAFVITCDKETQSSLPHLDDKSVQTKKSATKKKAKEHRKDNRRHNKEDEDLENGQVDSQVLKLLSPN